MLTDHGLRVVDVRIKVFGLCVGVSRRSTPVEEHVGKPMEVARSSVRDRRLDDFKEGPVPDLVNGE